MAFPIKPVLWWNLHPEFEKAPIRDTEIQRLISDEGHWGGMHMEYLLFGHVETKPAGRKVLSGETKIEFLAIRLNGMFGNINTIHQKHSIPAM